MVCFKVRIDPCVVCLQNKVTEFHYVCEDCLKYHKTTEKEILEKLKRCGYIG